MTANGEFDDRLARRNAMTLAVAQALYGIATAVVIMLGGIVGKVLAPDPAYATAPVTAMMIGTMIATVPASLFMQRFGRRAGFMLGASLGVVSGLVAAYAITIGSFLLFCAATHLLGYFQSSANFYRFAAADTASPGFRPKAIAWTLGGGLAGAVLAPEVVRFTSGILVLFAGTFVAIAAVSLLTLLVVATLRFPAPPPPSATTGRPLKEIATQPRFLLALAAGAVSFGMMAFVMTATPLAMLACGFAVDQATDAIRWHVVAMYLPSFFVGGLIARLGRERMALAGLLVMIGCGAIALSGLALAQFIVAMMLLGFGWNLAYVSATAIVTDCHRPEERGKVQALNDLVIFGFVALCSLLSGVVLTLGGWSSVNAALIVLVAIASLIVLLLPRLGRRPAAA